MRGKAILFPPSDGFSYWFPPDYLKKQLQHGHIGTMTILQQKATCRQCGKVMKPGEQAIIDYCTFDHLRWGINGFIHATKCIPLVTAVFGNMVNGEFVEDARISTSDNFTEGFYSHNLEEAQEEVKFLLDGYWNGIFELCYIELDGVRHPEPIYSETHKLTVVTRR